ncbi:bacteriocin-like WGxF protein [Neobacillus sp. KR4-4]|uniref:bacteriocin-like WGxF protein n=1 Tax=Neobacillus sp. KR4-4 TaxID=3344872 RepID=UPI0035CC6C5E
MIKILQKVQIELLKLVEKGIHILMIKTITSAFVNCLLFVLAGIIHRVIFRYYSLPFDNIVLYWGLFIGIFFILNIFSNLLFYKPSKNLNV